MITDVPGVQVGHWTDAVALTGCTAVLFPEGTVASGEVRGGAPATREMALLDPTRLVARLDAVLLSGGSAFGLAAADGVVRFCEERGMGFPTIGGPVPIVVGMCIFDLAVGDPSVRPGSDQGYSACVAATAGPVELGSVGAGTGATTTKWRGVEHRRPGAIVSATARAGELIVAALVVVNAFGEPGASTADVVDGTTAGAFENTTIGVVATNASLDKAGCFLVAQGAHDGLARAVLPTHTRVDGDAFVAAAVGGVEAEVDTVRLLALDAVERAIASV